MLSKYLMGAATAVALAGPAMADNWTMTTTWPSSLELIEIDKKFVEIANALVDDADLTIEFFEGGSLVPAGEVFGAVESGTIQAGGDWPGYWAGRDAEGVCLGGGVPDGARSAGRGDRRQRAGRPGRLPVR